MHNAWLMGGLRFALLGDPVAHSLSPVMHRRALADAGLDGGYETIRADRARLRKEIERLRRGETHGLNVTMPLKEDAVDLCDRLTAEAERAGSVNALKIENGLVVGHSTDVLAFTEIMGRWSPRFLHVLGAGGSARAALAAAPDSMTHVSARRPEAAVALCRRFQNATPVSWGNKMPGATVVNATPLGMRGEDLPDGVLDEAAGLIDLPYSEKETPAVAMARRLGIPVVDGVAFLAVQAAAVFTWWTGESVDSEKLAEAGHKGLKA